MKTKVNELQEVTSAADEDQPAIEFLRRKLINHQLLMRSSVADWNQLASLRQQVAGKEEATDTVEQYTDLTRSPTAPRVALYTLKLFIRYLSLSLFGRSLCRAWWTVCLLINT
ncbi:TPA: hypothetical protein ACH3X1_016134 [Trebouxia sp. C0004]